MDAYERIAEKIIERQESIIGPIAIERAEQVKGLDVHWSNHKVAVSGNKADVIDALVRIYQELFGQISVEVSKEAAAPFLSELPASSYPATLK